MFSLGLCWCGLEGLFPGQSVREGRGLADGPVPQSFSNDSSAHSYSLPAPALPQMPALSPQMGKKLCLINIPFLNRTDKDLVCRSPDAGICIIGS